MKNIILLCAAGMSTSMLVKKMREAAADCGYECTIEAYSISQAKEKGAKADVVLLGPQVRYQLEDIKAKIPGKPVEAIDMRSYGMMDGKAVIEQAMQLLG